MMAFKDIAYEPHPVSPARKKELNDQGFRVVDARFAPEGYLPPGEKLELQEQPAPPEQIDLTREGIAVMEKPDLLAVLEAHGWDGDKRLGVEKLREALTAIVFVDL
jgi:hypothetical protein